MNNQQPNEFNQPDQVRHSVCLEEFFSESAPVGGFEGSTEGIFCDFLVDAAQRIRTRCLTDLGVGDRTSFTDSAIQRMYDTRRDFVETAKGYYTRYFLAIAAVIYSIKFAMDSSDGVRRRVLFLVSTILCIGVAVIVFRSKRLLQSIYGLYAASTVTATINSLAVGEWNHAWFDDVAAVVCRLNATDESLFTSPPKKHRIFFLGRFQPDWRKAGKRQILADQWAANPRSILSINTVLHDFLISALGFFGILTLTFAALPVEATSFIIGRPAKKSVFAHIETIANELDGSKRMAASVDTMLEQATTELGHIRNAIVSQRP